MTEEKDKTPWLTNVVKRSDYDQIKTHLENIVKECTEKMCAGDNKIETRLAKNKALNDLADLKICHGLRACVLKSYGF